MATITTLPDEILTHVLFYVPAEDALANVQLVSSRFQRLASSPLLWRHHCRTNYAHWRDEFGIERRLDEPVTAVEWKRLFRQRRRIDARIAKLFEGLLFTRHQRRRRMRAICSAGEEARDYLVAQRRAPDSAHDVLARR